jgi:hypothetical protein
MDFTVTFECTLTGAENCKIDVEKNNPENIGCHRLVLGPSKRKGRPGRESNTIAMPCFVFLPNLGPVRDETSKVESFQPELNM